MVTDLPSIKNAFYCKYMYIKLFMQFHSFVWLGIADWFIFLILPCCYFYVLYIKHCLRRLDLSSLYHAFNSTAISHSGVHRRGYLYLKVYPEEIPSGSSGFLFCSHSSCLRFRFSSSESWLTNLMERSEEDILNPTQSLK